MEPIFTAQKDDAAAQRACMILRQLGYTTRALEEEGSADRSHIGLFGSSAGFRNSYVRMARHRFHIEGIEVPVWARDLPFLVAINAEAPDAISVSYRQSIKNMAEAFARWETWMRDSDAPWDPDWHREEVHPDFPAWRTSAERAAPAVPVRSRLSRRTTPVFEPTPDVSIERIVITGCALFNKPHTDVLDTIPEHKQRTVVGALGNLLSELGCETDFIVPGPELLDHRLRDHFHPFMFMSVAEVGRQIGSNLYASARLLGDGHRHARTDTEIAAALSRSRAALEREIVMPLAARAGQCVHARAWQDIIGPYLDTAHRLAHDNARVAERIYAKRVETRPSYQTVHQMDPARGLLRTVANNVFYIAEAMYLYEHPEVAVVNCEHEDTFWRGLEDLLAEKVWGSWRPFIGMVPKPVRQPWGY